MKLIAALPRIALLVCSLALVASACSDSNIGTNNSPPEASIEQPSVGTEVLEGTEVAFRGVVDDRGTPLEELDITWSSSIDGELLSEHPDTEGVTEFATSELVAGTHTITLLVRDGMGATGQGTVELVIREDAAPSISIVAPTANGVYYSNIPITLQATVEDAEDAAEDLRVSWTTEADGETVAAELVPDSTGLTTAATDLGEGSWVLIATASDTAEHTATDTVTITVGPSNTAPTCAITAPDDLSSAPIGELVLLEGTVADVDVPADWLTVSFESNVDGPLGDATPSTGGEVGLATSALTAATHTLTMHVADEVGGTCTDFIFLTVSTPPEATITTPAASDPLNSGDVLTLTGTASDAEDADDSLGVTWASDVDGLLSSPSPDSSGNVADNFVLSPGVHLLTLTATDSAHLTGTDTVTVSVNAGPTTPGVSIMPSAPTTADDLVVSIDTPSTDPDGGPAALTYDYGWTRDGAPQAAWAGLDTVPASATTSGQLWEVTVTATDGQASSAGATASVTVGNSPPSITGVAISPTAGGEATVFSCVPSGWYDADGDAPGYSWLWTVDGSPSLTTETLDGASFDAGQTLICTATPNDGTVDGSALSSSPVTVANSPPSITGVTITPSTAYTDTTLTANPSGWVDADGDAPSYLYEWFADSTAVGGSSDTLTGSSFSKGQVITVTVTPQDASSSGSPVTSAGVTILNTAPTAPSISLAEVSTPSRYEIGSTSNQTQMSQPYLYADVILATTSATLESFEVHGSTTSSCPSVDFYVLSSPSAASGTWTVEWSSTGQTWSSSLGYNDSGPVGVSVAAGTYYAIGYGATCSSGLTFSWNTAGLATDAGFGTAVGYVGQSYPGASGFSGYLSYTGAGPTQGMAVNYTSSSDPSELICSVDTPSTDADSDPVTYSFAWDVGGSPYTGATTTALPGDTVPNGDFSGGEYWTCEVTPNDGETDGPSDSASITTAAEPTCPALSFDGSNDTVVLGTLQNMLGVTNAFSVSAWVLDPGPSLGTILDAECSWSSWSMPANAGFVFQVSSATSGTGMRTSYGANVYDNVIDAPASSTSLDPLVWNHVVLTRDGSTVTFYVNGVAVQSTSNNPGGNINFDGGPYEDDIYRLGAYGYSNNNWGPVSYFDGMMAHVGVWSRALSTSEVVQLLAGDMSGSVANDLQGHWPMNEGTGNTVTDYSGLGNDGSLSGPQWVMDTCVDIETDADGDGWLSWEDCDDNDPLAFDDNGTSAACPGLSCLQILNDGNSTGDGVYWVDPNSSGSFEVYCDMTTAGGGWMTTLLVDAEYWDTGFHNDYVVSPTPPLALNQQPDVWQANATITGLGESLVACTTQNDASSYYWTFNDFVFHDWVSGATSPGCCGTYPALSSASSNLVPALRSGIYKHAEQMWMCSSSVNGGVCGSAVSIIWGGGQTSNSSSAAQCATDCSTYGFHTSPWDGGWQAYPICGGSQTSNGTFWMGVR